jgi:diadenosine tetraphosphate (Ap4A) HIT family hydrolase
VKDCVLCETDGGALIWRGARWRLIRADEPHVPAFWRWIANEHVAEISDLNEASYSECWRGLRLIERTIRDTLTHHGLPPLKMNVASLGNVVPHLHFHVIARFAQDAHFPAPIWAAPTRAGQATTLVWEQRVLSVLPQVDVALQSVLKAMSADNAEVAG